MFQIDQLVYRSEQVFKAQLSLHRPPQLVSFWDVQFEDLLHLKWFWKSGVPCLFESCFYWTPQESKGWDVPDVPRSLPKNRDFCNVHLFGHLFHSITSWFHQASTFNTMFTIRLTATGWNQVKWHEQVVPKWPNILGHHDAPWLQTIGLWIKTISKIITHRATPSLEEVDGAGAADPLDGLGAPPAVRSWWTQWVAAPTLKSSEIQTTSTSNRTISWRVRTTLGIPWHSHFFP